MRRNRLKTWFVLGYMVLLLNLGPSVHRAHFFGFHCHSHHSSCNAVSHLAFTHDCCSHGGNVHIDGHGKGASDNSCDHFCGDADTSTQSHQLVAGKATHDDCPLCKFFDQYNVTIVQQPSPFLTAPFLFCQPLSCPTEQSQIIAAIARGPPTRLV